MENEGGLFMVEEIGILWLKIISCNDYDEILLICCYVLFFLNVFVYGIFMMRLKE